MATCNRIQLTFAQFGNVTVRAYEIVDGGDAYLDSGGTDTIRFDAKGNIHARLEYGRFRDPSAPLAASVGWYSGNAGASGMGEPTPLTDAAMYANDLLRASLFAQWADGHTWAWLKDQADTCEVLRTEVED